MKWNEECYILIKLRNVEHAAEESFHSNLWELTKEVVTSSPSFFSFSSRSDFRKGELHNEQKKLPAKIIFFARHGMRNDEARRGNNFIGISSKRNTLNNSKANLVFLFDVPRLESLFSGNLNPKSTKWNPWVSFKFPQDLKDSSYRRGVVLKQRKLLSYNLNKSSSSSTLHYQPVQNYIIRGVRREWRW